MGDTVGEKKPVRRRWELDQLSAIMIMLGAILGVLIVIALELRWRTHGG
jgi:hypothetical protein